MENSAIIQDNQRGVISKKKRKSPGLFRYLFVLKYLYVIFLCNVLGVLHVQQHFGYFTDYDLTTSRRGKPKIHHRGHFYINQYFSGPRAYRYWACVKRYCKGRLNMDKDGRIIVRGEHTHSVNDTGILFTVVDESDSNSNVEYLTPSNHSKVEKIILKALQRNDE